jgi:hypothetical protein
VKTLIFQNRDIKDYVINNPSTAWWSYAVTISMIGILYLGTTAHLHAEQLTAPVNVTESIAPEIGVIPDTTNNCPSGSERITIQMDDEDTPPLNINEKRSGWIGRWTSSSQVSPNKNEQDLTYTRMVFCRVSSNGFKNLSAQSDNRHNYMVLKLSPNCPDGSVDWYRYFDNEDGTNKNDSTGRIDPSSKNQFGTTLRFCHFKGSPAGNIAAELPALSFTYGVLANPQFVTQGHHGTEIGWIYSDDEDNGNKNRTNNPTVVDTTTAKDNGIFRDTSFGTKMRLVKRGS